MAHDSQEELARINTIKAAFVLNIARFVTWPAEAFTDHKEELHLCLYGENVYGQAFENIRGKKIGKYRLEVTGIDKLTQGSDCEILVIPHTEIRQFMGEVQNGIDRPMLTIADSTQEKGGGVSRKGVLVTLVREGNRIGFEVDLEQVRKTKLHMSSELLKLATIIGKD